MPLLEKDEKEDNGTGLTVCNAAELEMWKQRTLI